MLQRFLGRNWIRRWSKRWMYGEIDKSTVRISWPCRSRSLFLLLVFFFFISYFFLTYFFVKQVFYGIFTHSDMNMSCKITTRTRIASFFFVGFYLSLFLERIIRSNLFGWHCIFQCCMPFWKQTSDFSLDAVVKRRKASSSNSSNSHHSHVHIPHVPEIFPSSVSLNSTLG